MTKQLSNASSNSTAATATGSNTNDWSKHAATRQQRLSADIEAFLSGGGKISEHSGPELDQPLTYKVTNRELHAITLFDDQKASQDAPESVTRPWNPVSVAVQQHDQ